MAAAELCCIRVDWVYVGRAGLTRASVDLDARVSTEFCTGKCCVGELFNVGYFMIDGTISQCLNGRKGNVD